MPATAAAIEADTFTIPGIDNIPPISTAPEDVIWLIAKLPLALISPSTVNKELLTVSVPIATLLAPASVNNKWLLVSLSTLKST